MKILVTGPSGCGKTYLAGLKRYREYDLVDADELVELHGWYDGEGNRVAFPMDAGADFLDNHSFLWNKTYLVEYLVFKSNIVIFGLSGNVFEMVDSFDRVIYVSVPDAVLLERLQLNSRENPMGQTEEQRLRVIEYKQVIEQQARDHGVRFVDGRLAPESILDMILE